MKNVIGHKNPDTDSVCSVVAYAEYLKKQGEEAQAFALGEFSRKKRKKEEKEKAEGETQKVERH